MISSAGITVLKNLSKLLTPVGIQRVGPTDSATYPLPLLSKRVLIIVPLRPS